MCLIVAQPTIALAQKTKLPNNLNMQLGLNHSRIIFDSLTTEGVVMPYFGLNIAKNLTPKMQLIFGGQLSFRAGEQIIPRNKRYRNTHFDLQVLGQYQPSADLVLLAGVQATQLLKSQVGSPDTSGRIFLPSMGFAPNTLETLVGIGLQVQKNARMQLLYTLPIRAKAQYTNLQLGLIVNTNVLLAKKENTRKTAASKQINEFKNSVLLVCLHPKDTLNQAIIRNFEVAYNFTPVYYFFSQNTAQITQTQTENLAATMPNINNAQPTNYVGKVFLGKDNWQLILEEKHLVLKKKPAKNNKVLIIKNVSELVAFSFGGNGFYSQIFTEKPASFEPEKLYFSVDALIFPLGVRLWQAGDRFAPLGMGGKRKLVSDYVNDQKLPASQRSSIVVLIDGVDEIVAVLGYRSAEKTKITNATTQILGLSRKPFEPKIRRV